MATKTRKRKRAPTRQDGLATKQQLLQAAGEVFALHGYAKATSKEICKRAKANIAAVNYHFGGKEALYAAVLVEAHNRLVSLQSLTANGVEAATPEARLRLLLTQLVHHIVDHEGAWELRLLSREILSPSPHVTQMLNEQALPKLRFATATIAQIMGLPVEHQSVSRSLINFIGPCFLVLIAAPVLRQRMLPSLDLSPEPLVDHMLAYAVAGMKAAAKKAR
jgi:TetR/AcrR family transcriptional regulator, regulator of cefoperazone and chloramphenicol sensitivity